jgi:hypothetical protein
MQKKKCPVAVELLLARRVRTRCYGPSPPHLVGSELRFPRELVWTRPADSGRLPPLFRAPPEQVRRMFRSISSSGRPARLGCWCFAAALVACLGLSGCTMLGRSDYDFSRVEGIGGDVPTRWSQDLRPHDTASEFWGVSNKARQIEQDCGIQ